MLVGVNLVNGNNAIHIDLTEQHQGHRKTMTGNIERCENCKAERTIDKSHITIPTSNGLWEYITRKLVGDWSKGEAPCFECEEECELSMPINTIKCPSCGFSDMRNKHKVRHFTHSDGKHLLYDCDKCGEKDQIITEICSKE